MVNEKNNIIRYKSIKLISLASLDFLIRVFIIFTRLVFGLLMFMTCFHYLSSLSQTFLAFRPSHPNFLSTLRGSLNFICVNWSFRNVLNFWHYFPYFLLAYCTFPNFLPVNPTNSHWTLPTHPLSFFFSS